MELRGGKDLKYSNEVPKWATYVGNAVLVFMGLLTLGFFAAGLWMLTFEDVWGLFFLFFFFGLLCGWMTWASYRMTKLQQNIVLKMELREDGFYRYLKNIRKSTVSEHLIPFSSMKEVLVGRVVRYVRTGPDLPGYFVYGARIIMVWQDERGETQYTTFGEETQENLDNWMERLQTNGVPVYTTQLNISKVEPANLPEAYAQIPKVLHANGSPRFATGYRSGETLPVWQSEEMRQRQETKHARNDARIFRPVFIGTIILNFLVGMFLMPEWYIADGVFSEDSPSWLIGFVNVALIAFSRTYWRLKWKWYRPLLDTLLLIAAYGCGLTASLLYQSGSAEYLEAVFVEGLTTGFLLCIIFFLMRHLTRRLNS